MLNYEQALKQGDTGEAVRAIVRNKSDGATPDFSSATIRFLMWQVDPETGLFTSLVDALAGVELPTASSGTLRYDWATGNTGIIGRHPGLFRVTYSSGEIEHYPREGYMWFTIEEKGP